jgi:hypothetical protein
LRILTELEGQKADMLKAFRSAIRLKHSLRADAEIREMLPEVERTIDAALAAGEPLVLNPAIAFEDPDARFEDTSATAA